MARKEIPQGLPSGYQKLHIPSQMTNQQIALAPLPELWPLDRHWIQYTDWLRRVFLQPANVSYLPLPANDRRRKETSRDTGANPQLYQTHLSETVRSIYRKMFCNTGGNLTSHERYGLI